MDVSKMIMPDCSATSTTTPSVTGIAPNPVPHTAPTLNELLINTQPVLCAFRVDCMKLKNINKSILKIVQENVSTITFQGHCMIVQRVKPGDSNLSLKLVLDKCLLDEVNAPVTISNSMPLVGSLLEIVVQHKTETMFVSYNPNEPSCVTIKLVGGSCYATINTGRITNQRLIDLTHTPLIAAIYIPKSVLRSMMAWCKRGEKIPDECTVNQKISKRKRNNLKRDVILQFHAQTNQMRMVWGHGESMLPVADVSITSGDPCVYFTTNLERLGEAVLACVNMCTMSGFHIYDTSHPGEHVGVFSSRAGHYSLQVVVVSETQDIRLPTGDNTPLDDAVPSTSSAGYIPQGPVETRVGDETAVARVVNNGPRQLTIPAMLEELSSSNRDCYDDNTEDDDDYWESDQTMFVKRRKQN
ncbi:DNA polymerase processivity subunit [Proboscivirus elephantidbeta5]|uniref:DNA polymerase processivity subunit n=1 Tax=Elephant endotheliotropic herpesvirus 5 TaxID=768738 RepID=A0A075CYP9_9BETA|nr:DNA polymerase processivity subunit [Elephant endotheliotropic herpesvirus 5]AHC02847.1 DNA polymerase processivity subunit [Elephant endotheliotropic herpesvirus 5]